MSRLHWLPDVLTDAGLTVHQVNGWKTRGYDTFDPIAVVCHATAGATNSNDQDEIRVLLNGSNTAPPPIAQLYLGRDGDWWVVASGRCNHIGNAELTGTGKAGNRYAIGIEAGNNNRDEPWPSEQYESYIRGVAAICQHMGLGVDRVYGHKEISTSGKTDPTFGMPNFRTLVSDALQGGNPPMTDFSPIKDVPLYYSDTETIKLGAVWGQTLGKARGIGQRVDEAAPKIDQIIATQADHTTKLDALAAPPTIVLTDEQVDRLGDRLVAAVLSQIDVEVKLIHRDGT